MREVQLIEKIIKKIPRGKIFLDESIANYSIKAVKRVLSELVKKNEIGSLSHNMYFRPRKSRYLSGYAIPPGTEDIIRAVSKVTGEIISIHAARALNLTGYALLLVFFVEW